MLHRSFKPTKCKTALKLAVSRIKLLRNKREAQLKQLKRELAQLLESGQDQTARIRVEHVVREEKTMAAYDLVEIYCELIVARLPMIESQKNCPIDLKEAISSVIFASPRCSDIPELMAVRKHMTAKYGKEFISAAVELRPDCGVNRLLVEKLSAKAPDGPTKIKILTAIAEDHNVKWEPKSIGENEVKSSQDLLVGPNTFEKATTYQEPSQVHVPPVHDERGPPNLHASSQPKPMDDISPNSYEQNASVAAREAVGNQSTTSSRSNHKIRSSGSESQEMDSRDSYSENRSSFPMDGQNWNVEFKDAASAAQAAAESAERASMAARAAAELSNREHMTRQYSSGSHNFGSGFRDEVPQNYVSNKDASSDFINSSLHRSSSGMHNEQLISRKQDNLVGAPDVYYRNSHENVVKHAQTASLTSSHAFGDDKPFAKVSQMPDIYSHNNSFEQENSDLHELSIKKKSSRTEDDYVTEVHGDADLNTQNNHPFGHARMNRQSGEASSSHFIFPSDNHNNNLNLNGQKMVDKAVDDLFVNEGTTKRNSTETSYFDDTSVIFDNSGSEDDDYEFVVDKNDEGQGSSVFFSSPDIKSQDSLANASAWSHGQVFDEKEASYSSLSHFSVVSERLTKPAVSSQKEDFLPVAFDDSDDPSSDNEVDLVKSKVSGTIDYGNSVLDESANHGAVGPSSGNDKNVNSDRSSWLSPSSAGSETVEQHFERKVGVTTVSEKNFGYDDLPTSHTSSKGKSSVLDLDKRNSHASRSPDTFNNNTETLEESHTGNGKELLYGTLKGGLRNRGYTRPPYIKKTLDEGSSLLGNSSAKNEQSPTVRTSISSDAPAQDKHIRDESRGSRSLGLRVHNASTDSDSYDLVSNSQETVTGTLDPQIQKGHSKAKKKPSTRAPVTYFDSDTSDSDDELPKQKSASLAHPVGGFSRRTSALSKTGAGLRSKNAASSKASVTTTGRGLGWKSSTVSYENRNQKASSMMNSSENWASSEHGSAEHAASKPISEPSSSSREETIKSSARVQPSNSVPKTVITESEEVQEASKSLNSEVDTPSKQKADHVHPKLPDYDSFAAHFLSLSKGRQ